MWRVLRLVYPHRRNMILGMVLGLGVALTYAASLGGMLPILKVIIGEQSLHDALLSAAGDRPARPAVSVDDGALTVGLPVSSPGEDSAGVAQRWYAPLLRQLAPIFPAGISPPERMQTLLMLLAALFAVNVAGNVLRCLSQYLILNASHRMMMDLRRHMYRKALRVPVAALSGDVSNRVNQFLSDTREIFLGVTTLFGKVAREPLKAICVLAVALLLDARLTLIVLAIAPFAVGLLWYFGRKVRKATIRLLQGYGRMLGNLEETLQGVDVVKGYGRESYERRRMWQIERGMLRQLLKLAWIEAVASPLIEVVGVLVTAAGIVWLAARQFSGEISPQLFLTMVGLLAAMLDPIRKIANVYNMVQRAGAAGTRVFEFLDLPEEHSRREGPKLPYGQPRAVRFEEVCFRYTPTQEPPALNGVTLEVAPGECLAIVGPNGSGKSTLVKLLPRLITPAAGRTLIAGHDVAEMSLRDLRQEIAVVTQRPVIFARTVFENIAYGKDNATRAEVRAAAQQAYAAEFIEQWPDGYDTPLGEFGTSVSGGQRQRISIARAFLKPATILIFDEATSEIDAESEHKIHVALDLLRRGKTTFLIAHRHTVMDMADRIAVMDQGRLVDVGTRSELLARCPLFEALYRSPGMAPQA